MAGGKNGSIKKIYGKKARKKARTRLKQKQYRDQMIKEIQNVVKKNTYPPKFDNSKWEGDNRKKNNCYAYALDINIDDPKAIIWCPGCISSSNISKTIWDHNEIIPRITNKMASCETERRWFLVRIVYV